MVFEVKSQTHQRHLVQTKPCAHQDPGKGAVTSTGYWTQTYLWVFECLMRRHRSAVTSCRDRSSGCSRPGWHGLWREVLLGEVTVSATIKLSSRQPTNWIIIIPKKFSHYCKSSRTHKQISQPGDPAKRLRTPREFDLEGQWDLITELPEDWENRLLEGTTKPCAHRDPGERSSDSTRDWARLDISNPKRWCC